MPATGGTPVKVTDKEPAGVLRNKERPVRAVAQRERRRADVNVLLDSLQAHIVHGHPHGLRMRVTLLGQSSP
jgi:hypothetical protein